LNVGDPNPAQENTIPVSEEEDITAIAKEDSFSSKKLNSDLAAKAWETLPDEEKALFLRYLPGC
jgi:hypothetical protein